MPKAARMILSGDLGHLDPAWPGWTLRDGKLISPEGIQAPPTDVLAMPFVQAQLALYQAENRRIKGMEEQPDSSVAGEVLAKLSSALPVSPHSSRSETDASLNRYERLLAVVGANLPVACFDEELRVTGECQLPT